jgi:hypothetical protein
LSELPGIPPTERSELRKLAQQISESRQTEDSLPLPPPPSSASGSSSSKGSSSAKKSKRKELKRLKSEVELLFGSMSTEERYGMSLFGCLFKLSRPDELAHGIDPALFHTYLQEEGGGGQYVLPEDYQEVFQLKEGVKVVRPTKKGGEKEKKRTVAGTGAGEEKKRKKKSKKDKKDKKRKKSRSGGTSTAAAPAAPELNFKVCTNLSLSLSLSLFSFVT